MAKKQNYYYVMVMTNNGPVFVTSIDSADKVAHWDAEKAPKEFGKYMAEDLTMGLTLNGSLAFTICSKYELDNQPYYYKKGGFEWKTKEAETD